MARILKPLSLDTRVGQKRIIAFGIRKGPVAMDYNVSQLLMESIGSTRSYELDEDLAAMPGCQADRATGTVRLLKTHHGVLVTATIDVRVSATCDRCLADFPRETVLSVEEECFPTVDPGTGRRMFPPEESEGVVHIDDRQILDLTDVLRQYLLTDAPIKALCRAECQGLCQECGSDLNEEKCKCDAAPIDPRWRALAGLLTEGRD